MKAIREMFSLSGWKYCRKLDVSAAGGQKAHPRLKGERRCAKSESRWSFNNMFGFFPREGHEALLGNLRLPSKYPVCEWRCSFRWTADKEFNNGAVCGVSGGGQCSGKCTVLLCIVWSAFLISERDFQPRS